MPDLVLSNSFGPNIGMALADITQAVEESSLKQMNSTCEKMKKLNDDIGILQDYMHCLKQAAALGQGLNLTTSQEAQESHSKAAQVLIDHGYPENFLSSDPPPNTVESEAESLETVIRTLMNKQTPDQLTFKATHETLMMKLKTLGKILDMFNELNKTSIHKFRNG